MGAEGSPGIPAGVLSALGGPAHDGVAGLFQVFGLGLPSLWLSPRIDTVPPATAPPFVVSLSDSPRRSLRL
jgi:hypothetical protein